METDLITGITEQIKSVEGLKFSRPDMPVDVVVQEASDLYDWCQKDKEILVRAGLDWKYAEELPIRAETLSRLQARWMEEQGSPKDYQHEWKVALAQARSLREELAHTFYHAFSSISDAHIKVRRMSKDRSNAGLLLNLAELAEYGSQHQTELERLGIDLGILEKARKMSSEFSRLHALVNNMVKEGSENQVLRNKAYYHLRQAIEEVRRMGKFVFWKDERRYKGYLSEFVHKKKEKQKLNSTRI